MHAMPGITAWRCPHLDLMQAELVSRVCLVALVIAPNAAIYRGRPLLGPIASPPACVRPVGLLHAINGTLIYLMKNPEQIRPNLRPRLDSNGHPDHHRNFTIMSSPVGSPVLQDCTPWQSRQEQKLLQTKPTSPAVDPMSLPAHIHEKRSRPCTLERWSSREACRSPSKRGYAVPC